MFFTSRYPVYHKQKRSFFMIIFILTSLLGLQEKGSAEEYLPVTILLDGHEVQLQGQGAIKVGTTIFVPAKDLLEKLDVRGEWDQATDTFYGYQADSLRIEISPNNEFGRLDGKLFMLDAPTKVIDGRLMVPSTLITQLLHYEVEFDSTATILKINREQTIAIDPYARYEKVKQEIEAKYHLTNHENKDLTLQKAKKYLQFWIEKIKGASFSHGNVYQTNDFIFSEGLQ